MYNDQAPEPNVVQPGETTPPEPPPIPPAAPKPTTPAPKKSNARRNTLIGIGAAAILVACCCALVVLGLLVDPFGWSLFDRLLGRGDTAAQAMPADTTIYMGVNLLNLTPAKIERLTSPFEDAIAEMTYGEYQDSTDLRQEFEDMVAQELGLDFEQDVLSWIGQYAGLGLSEIVVDPYYGELQDAQLVFSVEVRDREAADDFIAKLIAALEKEQGLAFRSQSYQDIEIFEIESDYEDERWAIARSGRLMLFSQNAAGIQDAIDAQNGDSLADMKDFRTLLRQLPGERALSFYLPGSAFEDIYNADEALQDLGLGLDVTALYSSLKGMAGAISITDAGLQVDALVSYDLDQLSETQLEMMRNTTSNGQLAEVFPADTMLFLNGAHLDLVWAFYKEQIEEMFGSQDYEEMMAELADEIGFDPTTELLPYLDGDYAMGLVRSQEGMLANFAGVDLGLIMLAEISDQEQVQPVVGQLMDTIQEQGVQITEKSSDGKTVYEAADMFMGSTVFAVSIDKDMLSLGTSARLLEETFSRDNNLEASETYRQVWNAFPRGTAPLMYFDLQMLLDVLNSSMDGYLFSDMEEALLWLEPLEQMAMGTSGLDGDTVGTTLIIFLPQP